MSRRRDTISQSYWSNMWDVHTLETLVVRPTEGDRLSLEVHQVLGGGAWMVGGANSPFLDWDASLIRTASQHRVHVPFLHQDSAPRAVTSSIASVTTPQSNHALVTVTADLSANRNRLRECKRTQQRIPRDMRTRECQSILALHIAGMQRCLQRCRYDAERCRTKRGEQSADD